MIILPNVILVMQEGPDRDYMAWLYKEYHRLMFATAWKYYRDRYIVEDIVSDSCIALIKNINTLCTLEPYKLRAYIVTTVRNTSLDYIDRQHRSTKHVVHASDEAMRTVPDDIDVQKEITLHEEVAAVWSAIEKLPYKEQRIMQLRYSQELPDHDIARILEMSEESIRKYVSRARAHIQAILHSK